MGEELAHRTPLQKFVEGVGPRPVLATSEALVGAIGYSVSNLPLQRTLTENCSRQIFEFFNTIRQGRDPIELLN